MNVKKGMITAMKALWWTVCLPPRTIHWIWKHKMISALAALGLWWGAGQLKKSSCHEPCRPRVTQQAQQKEKQQAKPKVVAPSLADMERAAEQSVEKKALVSSPTKDLSAKSGDRQLPAVERIAGFVEQGAKNSSFPDKKGYHSILICDGTNLENHAVMHIGFHNDEQKGEGQFKLYHSIVVPDGAKMPTLSNMFNISFDMPGMRMGIEPRNGTLMPTKCNMNSTTINVAKDHGRTLLLVNAKGGLDQVTDQAMVDMAFKEAEKDGTLTGKAKISRHDFKLYHDAGAYSNDVPQWQKNLQKNSGR